MQPDKKDEESFKDKFKHSVDALKKNEKVEGAVNYASSNTRDIVAYILLVAGLILLLFNSPWFGAALVGVIFGLYFAPEISAFVKDFKGNIEKNGMVRSLIIAGTLLALFISAPFIFIGAAAAVGLREFIVSENK
jgi:hypothetical protein